MFYLLYSRHWNLMVRMAVPVLVFLYGLLVYLCAEATRQYLRESIRYAVAFGVIQFGVLAFSIAALTAAKHLRIKSSALRDARCSGVAQQIAAHATAPDPLTEQGQERLAHLMAAALRMPTDFIQILDTALRSIRGSGQERLRSLCMAQEIFPRVIAESRHPNPQRAVVGLRVLGHLSCEQATQIIEQNCSDSRAVIRMTARQLVFANGSAACQLKILNDLALAAAWERIVLFQQLPPACPLIPEFLAAAWTSPRDEITIAALELVLSLQKFFPVRCSDVLANHANPEVRIKFFRAIPLLACASDAHAPVRSGLRDPDWRVRAMASKACRSLHLRIFSPELLAICMSPECAAEAGHAASALASLGGQAWTELRDLASRGTAVTRQIAGVIERSMLGSSGGAAR